MAVTGTNFPTNYANAITGNEQKKFFPHATSVGNKQKKTEDRMFLVISRKRHQIVGNGTHILLYASICFIPHCSTSYPGAEV